MEKFKVIIHTRLYENSKKEECLKGKIYYDNEVTYPFEVVENIGFQTRLLKSFKPHHIGIYRNEGGSVTIRFDIIKTKHYGSKEYKVTGQDIWKAFIDYYKTKQDIMIDNVMIEMWSEYKEFTQYDESNKTNK